MFDGDPLFARPGLEEEEEADGGRSVSAEYRQQEAGAARQAHSAAPPLLLADKAEWDDLDAEFPVEWEGVRGAGAGGRARGVDPTTTARYLPPQRRGWAAEPEEEDEWPIDDGPAQRRLR